MSLISWGSSWIVLKDALSNKLMSNVMSYLFSWITGFCLAMLFHKDRGNVVKVSARSTLVSLWWEEGNFPGEIKPHLGQFDTCSSSVETVGMRSIFL